MLKKFEQMDWNEDWEDEDPDKGPYDDQLIYGEDGPEFKCGDRVKYINLNKLNDSGSIVDPINALRGEMGTVVHCLNGGFFSYLICFDNYSDGINDVKHNILNSNGTWVNEIEIEKI